VFVMLESVLAGSDSRTHQLSTMNGHSIRIAESCAGSVTEASFEALYLLYNSTNGPNWQWKSESDHNGYIWNFTHIESPSAGAARPCGDNWQGVTCKQDGPDPSLCIVDILSLTSYGLTGHIPTEIGNLAGLTQLVFQENALVGTIPTTVGALTAITDFILNDNFLSGTIPSEMGLLSGCLEVQLSSNQLTGQFPDAIFTGMTAIVDFYAEINSLTGSIPTLIGSWLQLQQVYFDGNLLTSSLPTEIGNALQGNLIAANTNFMTGPIPSELGNWIQMNQFTMYGNMFSGTLPPEMGNFLSMEFMEFDDNLFSGTFPPAFGSFSEMQYLNAAINLFTGAVPSELGNLMKMNKLSLSQNLFTGTIPFEIAASKGSLLEFYINNNFLTGSFPESFNSTVLLQQISLNINLLTSSLPESLAGTWNLVDLISATTNFFTGSLPIFRSHLLGSLQIGQNYFSGDVNTLFPLNVEELFPLMILIDLNDNGFTGSFPNSLFTLRALQSLSGSSNCFSGELTCGKNSTLDDELNKPHSLQQLSLSGLTSGNGCRNYVLSRSFYSNSGYYPNSYMQGTIPSCFWIFENLTSLYLDGNGFMGPIAAEDQVFRASNLLNLSLASNELTGTVPSFLLAHKGYDMLDLSTNRLHGTIPAQMGFDFCNTSVSIDLSVNRFSGYLPLSDGCDFGILSNNILQGNIFTFNLKSVDVSVQVAALSFYGSFTLDVAMVIAAPLLLVGFSLLGYICLCVWRRFQGAGSTDVVDTTNKESGSVDNDWDGNIDDSANSEIGWRSEVRLWFTYWQSMKVSRRWANLAETFLRLFLYLCILAVVVLAYFAVLFCALKKVAPNSAVYKDQRSWLPSAVYLHGSLPAVLVAVGIFFVLLSFGSIIILVFGKRFAGRVGLGPAIMQSSSNIPTFHEAPSPILRSESRSIDSVGTEKSNLTVNSEQTRRTSTAEVITASAATVSRMVLVVFLNFCVVGLVNTGYLVEVLDNSPYIQVIQFALSIFKLLWNLVFIAGSLKWMKNRDAEMFGSLYFRYTIKLFNFVFVPCVATSIIADSCFFTLFQQQAAPETFLLRCDGLRYFINGTYVCDGVQINNLGESTLDPPFVYSYQCTSALITNYVPVLLYSYMISGLLVPAAIVLHLLVIDHISPESRWLKFCRAMNSYLPLVLQCSGDLHSNNGTDEAIASEARHSSRILQLFPVESLLSTQFLNATLFTTFGLAYPYLGAVIVVGAILEMAAWILAVGRFLYRASVTTVNGKPVNSGKSIQVHDEEEASKAKVDLEPVVLPYSSSHDTQSNQSGSMASQMVLLTMRSLAQVRAVDCFVVVVIACAFWGAMVFDMTADIYGNRSGLIAMCLIVFGGPLTVALSLYAYSYSLLRWEGRTPLSSTAGAVPEVQNVGNGRGSNSDCNRGSRGASRSSLLIASLRRSGTSHVSDRFSLTVENPVLGPLSLNSDFDEHLLM
jgi:hypothetical protein